MERNKQTKIMVIVSLCVAVLCLTLGFAAFSNTLTISSSATVTPNESDFKMVIYGMSDVSGFEYDAYYENAQFCNSSTSAIPIVDDSVTAPNAIIDNNTMTIKNLAPSFVRPGYSAHYVFKIKNEGKYTAYLSNDDFSNIFEITHGSAECIPSEDATPEYVAAACSGVLLDAYAGGPDWYTLSTQAYMSEYLTIDPGEYIGLEIVIEYVNPSGILSDGLFTVKWPDFKLNFTTVEPTV